MIIFRYLYFFLISLFSISNYFNLAKELNSEISPPVRAILNAVEKGIWKISYDSPIVQQAGCLVGSNKCETPRKIPSASELTPSPPPPDSKNPEYQRLAELSETFVPQTTFRQAFAHPDLLLCKNDNDLPAKLFSIQNNYSNKRIKNIHQCVTRQQFIRKSMDFQSNTQQLVSTHEKAAKGLAEQDMKVSANLKDLNPCSMFDNPTVKRFADLWKIYSNNLDGELISSDKSNELIFRSKHTNNGELIVASMEVLEYFAQQFGGIWTGCFQMVKSSNCRGALAGKTALSFSFFS